MIVIIGESASGKSTLQNMLIESDPSYQKIVTYTTRPMRDGEVNGIDYHFVTDAAFEELSKRGFFVEQNAYREWKYGTAKQDCMNAKKKIAVMTPAGLRALKRENIDVVSIYLMVDRRSRLIQILNRGDNIEEAYRRSLSDVGQFDGVVDEVNYVIDNTNYHMTMDQTLMCLKAILKAAEKEKA